MVVKLNGIFLFEDDTYVGCSVNMCLNGGTCIERGGYTQCACVHGYTGKQCEGCKYIVLLKEQI